MSVQSGTRVESKDGKLEVFSPAIRNDENDSGWHAQTLESDHIFLRRTTDEKTPVSDCFARYSVDLFRDLMLSLHARKWSGKVTASTARGTKSLYFSDGDVVFARSGLMDDRLGEVIYRAGKISLDELAESAAQVTRETKFGQVLIGSGVFQFGDLWAALQEQIKEITKSLFLCPYLYFELESQDRPSRMEVTSDVETSELLTWSYSYGCLFRQFLDRLDEGSQVILNDPGAAMAKYPSGTFWGDMIEMIREFPVVEELVKSSKLSDLYSYSSIMELENRGVCSIQYGSQSDKHIVSDGLGGLKAKVDAFTMLLRSSRAEFQKAGLEFPVQDLHDFALSRNPAGFTLFFLDNEGAIGRPCIMNMYEQCASRSRGLVEFYQHRIDSMLSFLLHLSLDVLPMQSKATVQEYYSQLVS